MSRNGLLIDYQYCAGCHTCEIACQKEHGYPVKTWGIKLAEIGPYNYEDYDTIVYEIVPVPTKLCDLCEERTSKGQLPTCVKHCQTNCMKYGPVDELVKDLEKKPRQTLFVPR